MCRGLGWVQQKPWLAVVGTTGISGVTDEASTAACLSGNDRTTFRLRKGIPGVEKVVTPGSVTAEELWTATCVCPARASTHEYSCAGCTLHNSGAGYHQHCRKQSFVCFFVCLFLQHSSRKWLCLVLTKSVYCDDFMSMGAKCLEEGGALSTLH